MVCRNKVPLLEDLESLFADIRYCKGQSKQDEEQVRSI